MDAEKVGDMTRAELEALIDTRVQRAKRRARREQRPERLLSAIMASVEQNRIVPTTEAPTNQELVRHDRDGVWQTNM